MSTRHPPVGITGLWIRRIGDDVHALVEVDGVWRKVIVERADGAFSHISEQTAILRAPIDNLTGA